jgi:hypothetical protein
MGRMLDALLSEKETVPAAIPAIPAILTPSPRHRIAESQESHRVRVEKLHLPGIRPHLLTLAADDGLPPSLIHGLPDADVTACDGYGDGELRAYLRALAARELLDAGKCPPEWGEPVARTCEGCGDVLLWADCPPVVKACPWCFRRAAGKPIARPYGTTLNRSYP